MNGYSCSDRYVCLLCVDEKGYFLEFPDGHALYRHYQEKHPERL